VEEDRTVVITTFIWGESLAKNRTIKGAALAGMIRETTGQEAPLEIVVTAVGEGESIPWEDRLLPFRGLDHGDRCHYPDLFAGRRVE
jgi:hypothetical protein